jgi:RNA polymerase sigma-70 factor (ECF subfamily)
MGSPEMAGADEASMVEALLRGDERAFEWLVQQHHTTLVRLALRYVRDPAIAEEVAQDTWLHVLKGLPRFQLRSSLKTWMTQILMNRARTQARRDRRNLPFTDAWLATVADGEPAVDQDRFIPSDRPVNADRWASAPRPFVPEERILAEETRSIVQRAIAALPVAQREVITLRDIEGRSAGEVCNTLGLTDTNQRVLLHRARSRVRAALEPYLSDRA